MKYTASVEAARLEQTMEIGGRRGDVGDYLVCGDGPGFLFLKATSFEMMFRPVAGAVQTPVNAVARKAAREPKEGEEPGRKFQGEVGALVLKALGEGPKRSREVGDWIRTHGLADYTNARASAVLTYLAVRGRVQPGKDHLWRLKG